MKYLGIDYGTKHIGLALSDDGGRLAFPLSVVRAGPKALAEVASLAREKKVRAVVIGESRDFKGEKNAIMEDVEEFKADLAELTGLPVEYELEFLTSAAAAHQFAPDGSRKKNPSAENLDASAAALILQSFLDKHRP